MPKQQSPIIAKDIDELTEQEIVARYTETMTLIGSARALWPGLTRLEESERSTSAGRNVGLFSKPFRLLFGLLLPKDGQASELAKYFDALGDVDHGEDPEKFEPELLVRRLTRVEYEQKIQVELDDLQRHFADDVLHTGNLVMEPGLLALAMARTLSATNKAYRSTLAPLLDALREMTKRARASAAQKRATKKDEGAPKPPAA